MATKDLDSEIRSQIDQFLVSISDLVRQSALQAVQVALGTSGSTKATPARRGPGRPRKATAVAPKARKKAAGKPGRRARRSSEDVEKVATQILIYAKSNPGHRLEEMGRGLKTDTANLKGPIKLLLAAGKLRTEGQKRGTKYFAGKGGAAKAKAKASSKKAPARKKAGKTTRRKSAKKSTAKRAKKAA